MSANPARPQVNNVVLLSFTSLNIDEIINLELRLRNVHDSTFAILFFLSVTQLILMGIKLSQAPEPLTLTQPPISIPSSQHHY